jgi:DNA-binding transcriptional MerR regulator
MLIGALATKTQLSRDTIRYYEKLGLLEKPQTAQNGYRYYSQASINRLQQIKQLKQCGFSLEEIQELLKQMNTSEPCSTLPALLQQKLHVIDNKIDELLKYKKSLTSTWQACSNQCAIDQEGLPSCFQVPKSQPAIVNYFLPPA